VPANRQCVVASIAYGQITSREECRHEAGEAGITGEHSLKYTAGYMTTKRTQRRWPRNYKEMSGGG
jgi:hypothetical protein